MITIAASSEDVYPSLMDRDADILVESVFGVLDCEN